MWLVGREYECHDHFMHGNRIVNKAVLRKVSYMRTVNGEVSASFATY